MKGLLALSVVLLLCPVSKAWANSLVSADVIARSPQGGTINYELKTRDRILYLQVNPASEKAKMFDEALELGKKVYVSMSDEGEIVNVLIGVASSRSPTP